MALTVHRIYMTNCLEKYMSVNIELKSGIIYHLELLVCEKLAKKRSSLVKLYRSVYIKGKKQQYLNITVTVVFNLRKVIVTVKIYVGSCSSRYF